MNGNLDNIALLKHLISKDTKLTSTEKLVAIALMSHRNNISMMCCPGLTLLSKETMLHRSTIQRTIVSLIKKKIIARLQKRDGRIYYKSQYYFFYDIKIARQIYENEESIFYSHHPEEVENFEFCLANNLF